MALVELDVFSGRVNPRWSLDRAAEATFDGLVQRLGPTAEDLPDPPGLGYRGFVVSRLTGEYHVYRGFCRTPTDVRSDPGRGVERFLLGTLPAHFENLRAIVDAEIQRP